MNIRVTRIVTLSVFVLSLLMYSCGTSSEERRQQEIEDSLRLEKERRELLDRANRMFQTDTLKGEGKAEGEELD
ncbi:MAG: hypothetical protein EA361_10455 [Bacteroidetes bacterium]|nr:MAG: hypothetical protein EA361_10455 [Bacteroidota bacterium]